MRLVRGHHLFPHHFRTVRPKTVREGRRAAPGLVGTVAGWLIFAALRAAQGNTACRVPVMHDDLKLSVIWHQHEQTAVIDFVGQF